MTTPLQLSRLIADAAAEKKARGVVRLDIRLKTSIADYFIICEGDTDRQVRAITDSIVSACKEKGLRPLRTAGYDEGSWVVIDYASVIVHIFLPGERSYYDLETLWRGPIREPVARPTNGATVRRVRPQKKAGSR